MDLREIAMKDNQRIDKPISGEEARSSINKTTKVDRDSEFYKNIEDFSRISHNQILKIYMDEKTWASPEKAREAISTVQGIIDVLDRYKSTLINIYLSDKIEFKIS